MRAPSAMLAPWRSIRSCEEMPDSERPPVLVVEDKAHQAVGHWPVLFAEIASGFAAVGCRVSVLTSRGWCLDGEAVVPFAVYRYGWLATAFDRLSYRLRFNQCSPGWRRWLRRAGYVLRATVITPRPRGGLAPWAETPSSSY